MFVKKYLIMFLCLHCNSSLEITLFNLVFKIYSELFLYFSQTDSTKVTFLWKLIFVFKLLTTQQLFCFSFEYDFSQFAMFVCLFVCFNYNTIYLFHKWTTVKPNLIFFCFWVSWFRIRSKNDFFLLFDICKNQFIDLG